MHSQIGNQLPMFLYLLRPSPSGNLQLKQLTHLLKPAFSEEGSNNRKYENAAYTAFLKYLREVASKTNTEFTLIMHTDFSDQQTGFFLLQTAYNISKSLSERTFLESCDGIG